MNTARLFTLADFIEDHQPGLGFNMNYYLEENSPSEDKSGHRCGTVACIAGHEAIRLRMEATGFRRVFRAIRDQKWFGAVNEHAEAKKSLDLNEAEARDLFTPWEGAFGWQEPHEASFSGDRITPQMAARVVRNAALTGKIDWSVAFGPADPEIEAELFRLSEANRAKVPADA